MTQFSPSALSRSAEYMMTRARPVDAMRYQFHFGSGKAAGVLDELAKYQNDDGGFGHAIEPDLRMPSSSPFATSVAFQLLREINADGSEASVRKGIAYLLGRFDPSLAGWQAIGEEASKYPRAPWWEYQESIPSTNDPVWANPRAELTGYLHHFSELVPSDVLAHTLDLTLASLNALPDEMEVHTMLCFMRAADMVQQPAQDLIRTKLLRGIQATVGVGESDWGSYGGRPLWFASTPSSVFANLLRERVQRELDFLIKTQHAEGYWEPTWSWGRFETDWEAAKVDWRGFLTMQNLLALNAWGRLN
jgi:hypothetical protein